VTLISVQGGRRQNDFPEHAVGVSGKIGKDSDKGFLAIFWFVIAAIRQKKPAKGRAKLKIGNNQRGVSDVVTY
jgi:hypothetical protein